MNIFDKIEYTTSKLIGIGDFSHGVAQVWDFRFELLKHLHLKTKKKINIFIEDSKEHTDNIMSDTKIHVGKEYGVTDGKFPYGPLWRYCYRSWDSVQFLRIIKYIRKNPQIKIIGVDLDKISGRDKYMASAILSHPNFDTSINLFFAANAHVDARPITEAYEDANDTYRAGYFLKKKLDDKYMIILTTAYEGTVRFSSKCSDDECSSRTFYSEPIMKSFRYDPYHHLVRKNCKNEPTIYNKNDLDDLPIIEFSDAVFPDGSKYQPNKVKTDTYDRLIFFNSVVGLPLLQIHPTSHNDKYTIIKELGHGMMGSVYLVTDHKSNKLAMKIEHILKKDRIESTGSAVWREIEFATFMRKKYPNHFMKLWDHWIDTKCKHIQDWKKIGMDIKKLPPNVQKYYNRLFSSKYCSVKIWSLIDLTLKDLIDKGNVDETMYYDLFVQAMYVLYLIHIEGYLHGDWKLDNIGLIRTYDTDIDIMGSKIKTHGYIVQIIDYGNVIHQKYELNNYWKQVLCSQNDIYFMLDRYNHNMIFNFKKFELQYGVDTWNAVAIDPTDTESLNQYLPTEISVQNKHILLQYLYKLIYWEKFEKQLVGNDKITLIPPTLRIPLETILYMIKHINNIKLILIHLIKK